MLFLIYILVILVFSVVLFVLNFHSSDKDLPELPYILQREIKGPVSSLVSASH